MGKESESNRRKFLAGALAATGAAVFSAAVGAEGRTAAPAKTTAPAPQRVKMRPFGDSSAMVARLARQYKVSPEVVRGIMRETANSYAEHIKSQNELRWIDVAV